MKNITLTLILCILLITTVSAGLGTFQKDECVNIKTILDATTVNISTISYPNSTIAVSNKVMTKNGLTFNYSFCNTSTLGTYIYDYFDDEDNVYVNSFEITPTGTELTTEQTYIYILALVFLVLLILGMGFTISRLPSRDSTDGYGNIVDVNQLKHLRGVLWIFIWTICLAILFIISNIGLAYMPTFIIGELFFTLYTIFFWVTIIGVPISFIWLFYKIFKDKEVQNMILRGVDIQGKP